jgi:MSHA pilin protein MshC
MRLSKQIEIVKHEAGHPSDVRFRERLSGLSKQNVHGFTLVELITIIVILGIISVAAIPRFFDKNVFDSRGYYDQVISTLRFAQKTAISQRRFVCVTFTSNRTIELTYDAIVPGPGHLVATCPGAAMTSPFGQTPYIVTSPTADVTLANFASFSFSALGRPDVPQPAPGISVSGYPDPVRVEAETGYVH